MTVASRMCPTPVVPTPARVPMRDGLGLGVLATLPFLPTLWSALVADDFFFAAILGALSTPILDYVVPALTRMQDVPTTFYRPVAFITLYAEVRAWDGWPLPMHVTNLLLHGLTTVGVWWVATRLSTGPLGRAAAAVGALAWAWFPRRVEAVAWLSCRPDLVATALATWSIVAWLEYERAGWRAGRFVAVLLWSAAMASKESVLLVPLALLALPPRGASWPRAVLRLWPFAATLALFLVARRLALGSWIGGYGASALHPSVSTAVKHLVYPVVPPLVFLNRALLDHTVNLVLTAVMGLLTLLVWWWMLRRRADDGVRVGVAWIAAGVLPVATLLPSLTSPMNDRLLYLSGIGFAVVIAARLSHASARSRALACLVVAALTWQTVAQSNAWRIAGTMTGRLVGEIAREVRGAPADARVFVAAAPDSVRGAYMLRNGLGFALQRHGVTAPERVVVLSNYLAERADVMPVVVEVASDGALHLRGRHGRAEVMVGFAEAAPWIDLWASGADDRFGRHQEARLTLKQPGLVLVVAPDHVESLGMLGPGSGLPRP